MTKAQERSIKRLENIIKHDYLDFDKNYEFKSWELTEGYAGSFFLFVTVGHKGDEGTLASIFCRETAHFKIGVRGAVSYSSHKVKSGCFRPFGWTCFYEASLAWDGKRSTRRTSNKSI